MVRADAINVPSQAMDRRASLGQGEKADRIMFLRDLNVDHHNSCRACIILRNSVEIESELDRPFDFLHLWGWERTEFSDEDGLLNDGDPFCLNH